MIDIHSHILPGVDDGVVDFDSSLRAIKWLADQGVTEAVATPHYIEQTDYASPKYENVQLLNELQRKVDDAGIGVKLHLGNEIFINEHIGELLDAGIMATMCGSKYILVEIPMEGEFPNWEEHLKQLILDGYKVILAHPERYVITQEDYELVYEMVDMGLYLQCNYRSILGDYGKMAEKVIKKMAKEKLIFALASDTHRAGRDYYLTKALKKFSKYYKGTELEQITTINPASVVHCAVAQE